MRTSVIIAIGAVTLTLVSVVLTLSRNEPAWMHTLRALPTQQEGRIMPLDSYARRVAVRITGRTRWTESRGPTAYAGREPVELFADLLFRPAELLDQPLVRVQNRPFKERVGLDVQRDFFAPAELARTERLVALVTEFHEARKADPDAQPTPDQDKALAVNAAVSAFAGFLNGRPLPLVPAGEGGEYRRIGRDHHDPGTEQSHAALAALGETYRAGGDLDAAAASLRDAIAREGEIAPADARRVRLELIYNNHSPWRMALVASLLATIGVGFGSLFGRRWLTLAGVMFAGWAIAEQLLGLGLRTTLLGRAPVSNTYESLLWMGIVAVIFGAVAQARRPSGQYLLGGLIACVLCLVFAVLVPLEQQTSALPAVLRSNYWLILHVLVIVASYGLFALAAVLGHVHLASKAFRGRGSWSAQRLGDPVITQIYRALQFGLVLLIAGTILGGVWAADSWGRFWGWDPKETWALISIVLYFSILHARYVGWLHDFGLAVATIAGFMAIVWTFYGVNYVMASGLHSYGFGSGGERWVATWAGVEILFVAVCALRTRRARLSRHEASTESQITHPLHNAAEPAPTM